MFFFSAIPPHLTRFQLVEAHRVFIKEGLLWKVCRKAPKQREFYLFNDLFLYASTLPTGGLFVHRAIPLNELRVDDIPDTETQQNAFTVGSLKKSFVLFADSIQEKAEWLIAITSALDSLKRANETLKRAGAAPAGAGSEAPVWQPDSTVKSCPLCNTEFTIWNRRVCLFFFFPLFSPSQHHCRSCGKVVCGGCSTKKLILPNDPTQPQRVCDGCYKEFEVHRAAAQGQ